MSRELRKIGFYSIQLQDKDDDKNVYPVEDLKKIITYILGLAKKDRKKEIEKSNKFYFLKSIKNTKTSQNIIFESAKYNHRPPLVDKDSLSERNNPKTISEGELEKTHVSLKYLKNEIVVVLEERKAGVTLHQITAYFIDFAKRFFQSKNPSENLPYYFKIQVVGKDNFLEALKKLKRAIKLDVFLNKKVLGSEFLKYANKTQDVKEKMLLTIKAKRSKSLKELVKQFFEQLGAEKTKIEKIRVLGATPEGNKILLDTDLIKKIEYIETELEKSTGIVNSKELFQKLNNLLENYNE